MQEYYTADDLKYIHTRLIIYVMLFSGCNARADVVFLLDSSGSVGHVDFRRIKQFAANMVSELSIGRDHTRVGLATYSSRSR